MIWGAQPEVAAVFLQKFLQTSLKKGQVSVFCIDWWGCCHDGQRKWKLNGLAVPWSPVWVHTLQATWLSVRLGSQRGAGL